MNQACKVVFSDRFAFSLTPLSISRFAFVVVTAYCYLLSEGQKVMLDVHPDSVLTWDYQGDDGTNVHVVIGQEEEQKLLAISKFTSNGH